ncbi:hypothetical protein DPMN_091510 [Dreissena polymorpha]|uniref:Uncharacterized protein n=1 Tax=Dreissena polymorpha TaxID=45954 RepID=A0A9D4L279_DREPO|nr:hypothetical protein DPMN_091510 [Dreissena polymorpha]
MHESVQDKCNPGVRNAISSDMFIETNFVRYSLTRWKIIGSTLTPETLKVFSLSLHTCNRVERDLRELRSANLVDTDEQHKEEKCAKINTDANDKASIRRKLTESIDLLDPSKHPLSLVNIVLEQ